MKLNINEIRKIIVEELQVLSEAIAEAAGPAQENTVTDFDNAFDYAYFAGNLEVPTWWAKGKTEARQRSLAGRSWATTKFESGDAVWYKVPAAAQRTLSDAHPGIKDDVLKAMSLQTVPASEPAGEPEPAAVAKPDPDLKSISGRSLAEKLESVLRVLDIDVYGPIIIALSMGERGYYGPAVEARAAAILSANPNLSTLKSQLGEINLDGLAGVPLRRKLASLTRGLEKIPVVDTGHFSLIYNLLAKASGIPVQGGQSLEDALLDSLTKDAREFKRQLVQAKRTILEYSPGGSAAGVRPRMARRQMRRAFDDLPMISQGEKVDDLESAQKVVERAEVMLMAARDSSSQAQIGLNILRKYIESDSAVSEKLFQSGILPRDEAALRQFI